MKLSDDQKQKLRDERGIIADEACDGCGKILGCVRWTRKGEPGEWCSRQCRDGIEHAANAQARIERRRNGRPAKYPNERTRRAAQKSQNANRQRDWRARQAGSNAKVLETG